MVADIASPSSVVLIQMPPWGVDTPPLGVASLAAYLRNRNIAVSVYDLNIELYSLIPAQRRQWNTQALSWWASGDFLKHIDIPWDAIVEKISRMKPLFIGCSATFASTPFLKVFLPRIRTALPEVPLIIGGGLASYALHRSFIPKEMVDGFIVGDGEETLYRIVSAFMRGSDWKKESEVPCVAEHCFQGIPILDLDALPFPSYDDFPLQGYRQYNLLPLSFSRGCINACYFCCDWAIKSPYRSRSAESIVAEIEYLVARYKRCRFETTDLLMNGNLSQLECLCDRIMERKLSIAWGGQMSVRAGMTRGLFQKMKQAGCGGVTFGLETLSDTLLAYMNKRFHAGQAAELIRWAKEAGLYVEVNLMVGFPGESEEDVDATVRFLEDHKQFIDRINSLNVCTIGPGMPLWDRAEDFGIDKASIHDWDQWQTKDGTNTHEIRLRRHAKIKKYLDAGGWKRGWENVPCSEVPETKKNIFTPEAFSSPTMISVILTLSCTLRCRMCELWKHHEDRSQHPSLMVWERFFDSLSVSPGKDLTVVFGGGEPLLFADELIYLVGYARKKGFRTSLATSGYLLTEDHIKRLAQAGLQYIAFTVYSIHPRVQDMLRGVSGSFQRVVKAIAYIHKYFPALEVAIDTVLMEPTRKEIIPLIRWAEKQKGISRLFIQAVMQPFHTKALSFWYKNPSYSWLWPRRGKDMVAVIDQIRSIQRKQEKKGRFLIANSAGQFEMFKKYFMHPDEFIKRKHCPVAAHKNITVMPDGAVSLCPFMPPIGSIKNQTLDEVMKLEEAEKRVRSILSCTTNCHHIVNCWYEEESSALTETAAHKADGDNITETGRR